MLCEELLVVANKTLGILHLATHLIRAEVDVRAILGRNLGKELGKELVENLHTLLILHLATEDSPEVLAVTRNVELWDNHHATLLGILNHITNLVVGVELARVTSRRAVLRIVELWVALALDTPRWVVGQMPMEYIELVCREEVDILFEVLHRAEVTTCVVHKTTNWKGWVVLNLCDTHQTLLIFELCKGSLCPNQALCGLGTEYGCCTLDFEGVTLIGKVERSIHLGIHLLNLNLLLSFVRNLHRGRNQLLCCEHTCTAHHNKASECKLQILH